MSVEDRVCKDIARLVNLIAFDVCDVGSLQYIREADALKVTAVWRILAPIPDHLHTPMRKAIRALVTETGTVLPGAIGFEGGTLRIVLYKKQLRGPAYDPDVSPNDHP